MMSSNGLAAPKPRFIQPRTKAEVAFAVGANVGGKIFTRAYAIAATEFVDPAIEARDTRILCRYHTTEQACIITDTFSNHAENESIDIGKTRQRTDAPNPGQVPAIIYKDGVVGEVGPGAGGLYGSVENVVWLARPMACYNRQV